jgi:hypothetical protein
VNDAALLAEVDRLRAELKSLSTEVRVLRLGVQELLDQRVRELEVRLDDGEERAA